MQFRYSEEVRGLLRAAGWTDAQIADGEQRAAAAGRQTPPEKPEESSISKFVGGEDDPSFAFVE